MMCGSPFGEENLTGVKEHAGIDVNSKSLFQNN